MKYLSLILLIIFSVVVYKNKDYLAQYTDDGLATVLNSGGDNYVEPLENIFKTKIESGISTSTKKITNSTSTRKSFGSFNSKWTHYFNDKPYIIDNQKYSEGYNIKYYFTDWDKMEKSGFFLGWSELNNKNFSGCGFAGNDGIKSSTCSFWLYRNTEMVTKYQSCAKPFPEHVYFKDINALERKLVQFANNKADSSLKIKARGEVAALAIQYANGGVCAKFTDGCVGGVSCSINDRKDFLNQYKEKSIKNVFDYHTHDLNTGTAASKDFREYLIKDGKKYITAIPSSDDFGAIYFTKKKGEHNILGVGDTIDKVISPNGEGYVYDLPVNAKSKKIFDTAKSSWVYNNDLLISVKKVLANSMNNDNRKNITNKDAKIIQDYLLEKYKDDFDATYKQFWVN